MMVSWHRDRAHTIAYAVLGNAFSDLDHLACRICQRNISALTSPSKSQSCSPDVTTAPSFGTSKTYVPLVNWLSPAFKLSACILTRTSVGVLIVGCSAYLRSVKASLPLPLLSYSLH
jgi:hypothetical protein